MTDLTPSEWRWKTAEPGDEVPKGEWWKVFGDGILDELERDAVTNNQVLRAAVARVDQARAVARVSRSRFFPELSLEPSFSRERTSANQPTPIPIPPPLKLTSASLNTFSVPFDMSYEIDLWGRVRRSFEAARAGAEASVADYQNVLLTLTADVAVNYFLLRDLDTEIQALRHTVDLRRESLDILNNRLAAGAVSGLETEKAKTDLAGAKSELADALRQRAETLDALALLCGKPASSFEVAEGRRVLTLPVVPAALPSSLLERRPDVAAAERTLAARNAQIGVAISAYFPVVHLTGQIGYMSGKAGNLFSGDSLVWAVGPGASLPLFNAGRTAGEVAQAGASYQEALSGYRQAVLTAFKEVEDSLAQISLGNEQSSAQSEALASAGRIVDLLRARYEAGAVGYLEVADAERNMLQYKRKKAQIEGRQFVAVVRLIKASGGGWSESRGPEDKKTTR